VVDLSSFAPFLAFHESSSASRTQSESG
jgi:hypothetical protein